jgi:elongation factor G
VTIAIRPLPRGGDLFRISNQISNRQQFPKAFIQAAERTLEEGLRTGGNRGYPMIYVDAELTDLQVHPEKTNEGAVVGAVLKAVDSAIRQVGTVVLEPVMHLEILAPPEVIGDVTNYLNPRRAIIHEMADVGGVKRLTCEVPLAEMFGFGKALPKLTGGRASFSMEPRGYQEIPPEVAAKMFAYL